jgi:hypothetical protein
MIRAAAAADAATARLRQNVSAPNHCRALAGGAATAAVLLSIARQTRAGSSSAGVAVSIGPFCYQSRQRRIFGYQPLEPSPRPARQCPEDILGGEPFAQVQTPLQAFGAAPQPALDGSDRYGQVDRNFLARQAIEVGEQNRSARLLVKLQQRSGEE